MKRDNRKWSGYDIEELRIRQATTSLRIEIEKERLKCAGTSATGCCCDGTANLEMAIETANNVMHTVKYGIKSFKMVKNFVDMLRNVRK